MPFKQFRPGSPFYTLKLQYQGKEFTFIAEYVKFNNLKEYWHLHANQDLLSLSYHVQTKALRQETVFGKAIPDDFLKVLENEFQGRK